MSAFDSPIKKQKYAPCVEKPTQGAILSHEVCISSRIFACISSHRRCAYHQPQVVWSCRRLYMESQIHPLLQRGGFFNFLLDTIQPRRVMAQTFVRHDACKQLMQQASRKPLPPLLFFHPQASHKVHPRLYLRQRLCQPP